MCDKNNNDNAHGQHKKVEKGDDSEPELGSYRSIYKTNNKTEEFLKNIDESIKDQNEFKEFLKPYDDLATHDQLKEIIKSYNDLLNTHNQSKESSKTYNGLPNNSIVSADIIKNKADLKNKDKENGDLSPIFVFTSPPIIITNLDLESSGADKNFNKEIISMVYRLQHSPKKRTPPNTEDTKNNYKTKIRTSNVYNNHLSDSDDDLESNIENDSKYNFKTRKRESYASNNNLSDSDDDLEPNIEENSKNNFKTKKATSKASDNSISNSDDDVAPKYEKNFKNSSKMEISDVSNNSLTDSDDDIAANTNQKIKNNFKTKKPAPNAYNNRLSDSDDDPATNIEKESKNISKKKNFETNYDNRSSDSVDDLTSKNAPVIQSSINNRETLGGEPETKYSSNSNLESPMSEIGEKYSTRYNDYLDSLSYPNIDDKRSSICRRSPLTKEQEGNEFNICACSTTEGTQSFTETKQSVFHSKYEMWMRRYVARLLKCSNEENAFIAAIKNDVTLTPDERNVFIRVFCEAEKHVSKGKQPSKEKLTLTEKFKQKFVKKNKQTDESNTRQLLDRYETCPQSEEPSNEVYDEMRAYFERYVRDYLFTWNRWLLLHLNHVHKEHAQWMEKVLSTKELTEENKEAILRFLNGDGEPLEKILQNQRKNKKPPI